MPRDAAADVLLAEHPDPVAGTAQRLRDVVLGAEPDLVERARQGWHSINYTHPTAGFVCAIFPFADRVDLVFERGVLLPDPQGRLTGTGRQVRILPFHPGEDVDAALVTEFLDLAVEVGAGLRRRAR